MGPGWCGPSGGPSYRIWSNIRKPLSVTQRVSSTWIGLVSGQRASADDLPLVMQSHRKSLLKEIGGMALGTTPDRPSR